MIWYRKECLKLPFWANDLGYVTESVKISLRLLICPRHWLPSCLHSWAEYNFSGKPTVVGNEKVMWTLSAVAGEKNYDITTPFFPQFCINRWNCAHSVPILLCCRSIVDASGTEWNRWPSAVSCHWGLRPKYHCGNRKTKMHCILSIFCVTGSFSMKGG